MMLRMDTGLKGRLDQYIRVHYVPKRDVRKGVAGEGRYIPKDGGKSKAYTGEFDFDELIRELGETFHEMLFRVIREKNMDEAEVYKKAHVDRRLFSKIRNNPAYHPKKNTVLAIAVALQLDLKETEEFLAKAEYAFSPSSKSDLIIRFFIENGIYDVQTINLALYEYGQPVLGS